MRVILFNRLPGDYLTGNWTGYDHRSWVAVKALKDGYAKLQGWPPVRKDPVNYCDFGHMVATRRLGDRTFPPEITVDTVIPLRHVGIVHEALEVGDENSR